MTTCWLGALTLLCCWLRSYCGHEKHQDASVNFWRATCLSAKGSPDAIMGCYIITAVTYTELLVFNAGIVAGGPCSRPSPECNRARYCALGQECADQYPHSLLQVLNPQRHISECHSPRMLGTATMTATAFQLQSCSNFGTRHPSRGDRFHTYLYSSEVHVACMSWGHYLDQLQLNKERLLE